MLMFLEQSCSAQALPLPSCEMAAARRNMEFSVRATNCILNHDPASLCCQLRYAF